MAIEISLFEIAIIVVIAAFVIFSSVAIVYYNKRKSLEIIFKKSFYKDSPEMIKEKILGEM